MSEPSKDTIYIDIDDEITTIIEKVRGSSKRVVALVLPKRAAVLQSVVNMKLLKKAGDKEKKNVVLITSEAGLLPLAGSVGLHVAKTLQSKPDIPDEPEQFDGTDTVDEPLDVDSEPEDFDPKEVADKPVGDLAASSEPAASTPHSLEPDETIDLNEDELEAGMSIADARAESKKGKKAKKDKKNKKLKVPNFIRFRRWLIVGAIILILIIIGLIILGKVLPKAVVTIQTNSTTQNTSLTINLSTSAKALDPSTLTVPATLQQVSKSNSQQVPTTGTQNNGQKAAGSVTLALNDCSQQQVVIPAGTGVGSNGLTFITQSSVTLQSVQIGQKCNQQQFSQIWSASVDVTAQSGGSQYNIQPSTFSVAGFSDVSGSSSAAMSGGTDSTVSIVAQADVATATQKIATQDTGPIKTELENDLTAENLDPLASTFTSGTPTITTTPAVGTQANNVTVTQVVVYTMFGVHKSDLQTLVDSAIDQQINTSQQSILNDGVDNAGFNVLNQSNTQAQLSMTTTATVGSQLDVSTIKKQIVGKKSADIQSTIKTYPGVVGVNVHFSPFWVTTVPSNLSKTTITIQKASGS